MSSVATLPRPDLAGETRLRALHVVAGLSQSDGGPSYYVPRLCRALATDAGAGVTLLTVARGADRPGELAETVFCGRSFPQSYAAVPLLRSLRLSAPFGQALYAAADDDVDVIHDHGLWLIPNVQAGWAADRARKPLIVSPHGMLSPTARSFSARRKQVFWRLLQGPVVRGAACIHVTCEAEYAEVRALGLSNPVAIISNGVDVPDLRPEREPLVRRGRTVLSVGRIHPKKGLDRLVCAWAKVEADYPDWRLRIVGPAEGGHDTELTAQATSLGLARITVEGPVYGADKLRAFAEADLFVLPTLNENFGITVAEALSMGIPVISTMGAPWSGLISEGCGWWIEHGPEPLAATLAEAMATPKATLAAMGERGRAWVERDFSWRSIATDMTGVYRWLARGADAPSFVRFD